MQKNPQEFSMQEALRLANSPMGQQLLALLRQKDPAALQEAMNQAASGNYAQVKDTMSNLLSSPEVQTLLQKMGDKNG